ncbi:MAG: hypothetical protein IJA67_06630 [Oscillospiraceae bacterium]|nr:hypothetical protein [Oscillospiraceae bacterium]
MGFFSWLKDKLDQGRPYIVDEETLRAYLQSEIDFSLAHNLESVADLYIHHNGQKHDLMIWNFAASRDREERNKGLLFYYDDEEFLSIDDLFAKRLTRLSGYFKIELKLGDSVFLNQYRDQHPELSTMLFDQKSDT